MRNQSARDRSRRKYLQILVRVGMPARRPIMWYVAVYPPHYIPRMPTVKGCKGFVSLLLALTQVMCPQRLRGRDGQDLGPPRAGAAARVREPRHGQHRRPAPQPGRAHLRCAARPHFPCVISSACASGVPGEPGLRSQIGACCDPALVQDQRRISRAGCCTAATWWLGFYALICS